MNRQINIQYFKMQFRRMRPATLTLVKWGICAFVCGLLLGFIGSFFYLFLNAATQFREQHPFMLLFLPCAGLLIVFIYYISGVTVNTGTDLVITAIQSEEEVPLHVAPLIIISTILTHLCGGSAGREGAALQIGGSIGNTIAKLFHFDEKDTRILIMCGMSACFSALFGTPVAAAIFSMEVISVGIMYYAALVPCVLSAFIASGVAKYTGIERPHFNIGSIPALNMITGIQFLILSVIFAFTSITFCIMLHKSAHIYQHFLKNPYAKIVLAGLLIILMRFLFSTTDYLGAGTDVIASSFVFKCAWYVFLLKMIFTAVTLGGGYKGGEIVPALFVGATLGSFLASVFGLPVGLCAACGMVSVFCGVTNCPLTALIMSVELFNSSALQYYMLCIALSYLLSGYYSLYNSQRIVYSKYKTVYINRQSH
jgi:H+/Cl- antiporter ClcA